MIPWDIPVPIPNPNEPPKDRRGDHGAKGSPEELYALLTALVAILSTI